MLELLPPFLLHVNTNSFHHFLTVFVGWIIFDDFDEFDDFLQFLNVCRLFVDYFFESSDENIFVSVCA